MNAAFCRSSFSLRFFTLLSALIFLGISPARAIISTNAEMQLGNPSNATADTNNHDHYLIQRSVESLDYSDHLGEPNWVSWDLTSADIGNSGRSSTFFTDTNLPADFYEVTTDDYNGVGTIDFNRGHMCPSEDRTDNITDNDMVFFMSNIIPQAADNNQGPWANFESYCQSLAEAGNELLITCGPSLFTGELLPSGKAAIPTYTWKIAVVVPPGTGTALSRITTNDRVITIRIPNTNGVSSAWQNYISSPAQIQFDTGLTFFTALPTNVAAVFLNEVDGATNPPPALASFAPTSGPTNTTVILTGSNFTGVTAVTFNNTTAAFAVNSSTQITAVVPALASSGEISLTGPGGISISSNSFVVTGGAADLALSYNRSSSNLYQGSTGCVITLTVNNSGGLPSAGAVTVTDSFPADLVLTAVSAFGWSAVTNASPVTFTRSDALAAGASYSSISLTFSAAVTASASVTNIATVAGGGDTNLVNNSYVDVISINPAGGGGGTNTIILTGWSMNAVTGYGASPLAPTTNAPNLAVTGLTRGVGVSTSGSAAARAWGGSGWTASTSAAAITSNQFATFAVSATSGYLLSCTTLTPFNYRRSSTGPANGLLQYQIGSSGFNDITTVAYTVNTSGGSTLGPFDLSGIAALQNIPSGSNVTFRIVNWGGSSSGTWYIFNVTNNTSIDFALVGTVAAPSPIQSWRLQYFGSAANSGAAADGAISSSDGMVNLLKYAYGFNPFVPAANPLVPDISTGFLQVTLPKNPNATDVSFQVQITSDLTQPWLTNGLTVVANTATELQVQDDVPVAQDLGGRFMRLEVTGP